MNKLEQLHLDAMRNFYSWAHSEEYITARFEKPSMIAADVTENIAIEFAEWVSKYDWVFMSDRNYWVNDDMSKKPGSTKNLFTEFLKQRQ